MPKLIRGLYLVLFVVTPFLVSTQTSELFELPKMYFIYSLTILIIICHLFNYFRGQVPLFTNSSLAPYLLLFWFSQLTSTYFSIDRHTSIFGYYSRLNGGLISLTAYLILYFILIIYINQKFTYSLVSGSLVSGLLISTYGLLQHFGVDRTLWQQDVVSRVFATFGQPNWLAAYLCILLPFAIDRFFRSKNFWSYSSYLLLVTSYWSSLLFTKSKSGLAAAIISLTIYGLLYLLKNKKINLPLVTSYLVLITLSFLISNPIKDFFFPPKLEIENSKLEIVNITPSGNIRRLIWQGAIDLWRQYPLFGTGPETFAFSYYWVRPPAHNLTSEWNFVYNKAHNEYLNYLATSGSLGLITYLILIFLIIKTIVKSDSVLKLPILSSFLSILITNFFGFSISIISLYFFLLPTLIEEPLPTIKKSSPKNLLLCLAMAFCIGGFLESKVLFYYLADIAYNSAKNPESISPSLSWRPTEPLYLLKLAELMTAQSIANHDESSLTAIDSLIKKSLATSPYNLNLWKASAQIYANMSTVKSDYYLYAIECLNTATKLAPTDAMSFYLLGKFYANINRVDLATPPYQKALELKSNFDWVSFELGKIYFNQKKYDLAKPLFEKTLKIAPTNTDARDYLQKISKLLKS